jgi:hypothetical protein
MAGSKYGSPSTINSGRETIYNPMTSYTAGNSYGGYAMDSYIPQGWGR